MEGWNEPGFSLRFEVLEGVKNRLELGGAAAGRNLEVDFLITAAQSR